MNKKMMLTVEHLSCGYGKTTVIHDLSFQVEAGGRLCVLGPNGCGKTTLLRALAGVLSWQGKVEADSLALCGLSPKLRAKKVALMSQFSQTAFAYTVYEAVMLGRYAHQTGSLFSAETAADRRAVEEALRRTGMGFAKAAGDNAFRRSAPAGVFGQNLCSGTADHSSGRTGQSSGSVLSGGAA